MNSNVWKRIMKNGSLFMVFCFSFSIFFGVTVQASSPVDQSHAFISQPSLIDSNNFAVGFGIEGKYNSLLPYSSADPVDVSAKVYVRHYHRKDGTPVKSHYRRDPR
ncbi:MAG: hypothetical protein Q7U51_11255 [Methanoregula sp.]|nr:hypothetical protein [Methanoregula sp.]